MREPGVLVAALAAMLADKKMCLLDKDWCTTPDHSMIDNLDDTLRHLVRRKLRVVFENRHPRYCFGVKNYGEVRGTCNPADDDPFDVFAPGYSRRLPFGKEYVCKDIIGVYELENGNHKIAVRLFVPSVNEDAIDREIEAYCERYSRFTRKKGTWRPASFYTDILTSK